MRFLLLLLLFFGFVNESADKLLDNLDSENSQIRNESTDALIKIGTSIIDKVEKYDSKTTESKLRKEHILSELKKQRLFETSYVKKGDLLGEYQSEKIFSDKDGPYWEVIDSVCLNKNLDFRIENNKLFFNPVCQHGVIRYNGPVRIEIDSLRRGYLYELNLLNNNKEINSWFQIFVRFYLEPKILLISADNPIITKITIDGEDVPVGFQEKGQINDLNKSCYNFSFKIKPPENKCKKIDLEVQWNIVIGSDIVELELKEGLNKFDEFSVNYIKLNDSGNISINTTVENVFFANEFIFEDDRKEKVYASCTETKNGFVITTSNSNNISYLRFPKLKANKTIKLLIKDIPVLNLP